MKKNIEWSPSFKLHADTLFPVPDLCDGEVVYPVSGTFKGRIGIAHPKPHQTLFIVVQFGADGPYHLFRSCQLGRATYKEAQHLLGVGGAKIRKNGKLVKLGYK